MVTVSNPIFGRNRNINFIKNPFSIVQEKIDCETEKIRIFRVETQNSLFWKDSNFWIMSSENLSFHRSPTIRTLFRFETHESQPFFHY